MKTSPLPPEYRLLALCQENGCELVDFIELCTATRHRPADQPYSALTRFLRDHLGRNWALVLFRAAEPEIRVTVIEEATDQSLRDLFVARRLGQKNIKKLAVEYCDWVATLFGLPVPLDQTEGLTD